MNGNNTLIRVPKHDTVRSVERALQVIELLDEHKFLGLEELHYLTRLPKATLSRLLHTLRQQGWLYRNLSDQRYHLSANRLYGQSTQRQGRYLVEQAAPLLQELSQRTGLVADISFFDGQHLHVLDSAIPPCLRKYYPRQRLKVGNEQCSWHHSAMGQACIGALNPTKLYRLVPYPAQTGEMSLTSVLHKVRQRGFGQRTEGYWEYSARLPFHIRAIALPIQIQQQVLGSMALHWPQHRASVEEIKQRHLADLRATVQRLQLALQPPALTSAKSMAALSLSYAKDFAL